MLLLLVYHRKVMMTMTSSFFQMMNLSRPVSAQLLQQQSVNGKQQHTIATMTQQMNMAAAKTVVMSQQMLAVMINLNLEVDQIRKVKIIVITRLVERDLCATTAAEAELAAAEVVKVVMQLLQSGEVLPWTAMKMMMILQRMTLMVKLTLTRTMMQMMVERHCNYQQLLWVLLYPRSCEQSSCNKY